jgi:hypothetical protein
MLKHAGVASVALILFQSAVCQAQPLSNVAGFDVSLLDGKLCKGTFDTGGTGERDVGAVHVRFFVKGNELSADLRSKLGDEAFQKAGGDPFAATGEVAAAVRSLGISGTNVVFVTATGGKWTVTYQSSALVGEVDPRGIRGREKWMVAKARLVCA